MTIFDQNQYYGGREGPHILLLKLPKMAISYRGCFQFGIFLNYYQNFSMQVFLIMTTHKNNQHCASRQELRLGRAVYVDRVC